MRKRKKAKKKGEDVVIPDDEEEMKDFSYRCQKRIERGTYFNAFGFFFWLLSKCVFMSCTAGLLFHVEVCALVQGIFS